jgi:hypothetical protein
MRVSINRLKRPMYLSNMSMIQPLKKFLNDNREIYTIRKYLYDEDKCNISGVGNCKRELVYKLEEVGFNISDKNTYYTLDQFVSKSGFKDINDWMKTLKYFVYVSNPPPLYLWHISKEDE